MSKNKEKEIKPPVKQYYTVKLQAMAPVELTFRILAESAHEAAAMVEKHPLPPMYNAPRPNLSKLKKIQIKVFKFGTSTYEFFKNFSG